MKNKQRSQKKTKGIFQFIFFVFTLAAVVLAIKNPQILQKRASVSDAPQNVMVANNTDRSFTVLWTTGKPASGSVTYTLPNGKPATAFDARDKKKKKSGKYKTHLVQIKKLRPNATYAFYITSNATQYGNGAVAYTAETAKRTPKMNPSHSVLLPIQDFNKKNDELIVAFTAQNGSGESNTLATLVQNKKVYLDLANFRTKDLQKLFELNNNTTLSVFLVSDNKNFGYNTKISARTNKLSPVYLRTDEQRKKGGKKN